MFTLNNFYKSKEWETFRQVVIGERTADDGFVYCAECGKPIIKKYDLIVHHKIELTELNVNDYAVSLNSENVVCVHFVCHNKIHKRFGYGSGGYVQMPKKVYIVYGSPCSGKTTWVSSVAGEDDIIVDLDALWNAVTIDGESRKPDTLISVVYALRDTMYDLIKYRNGKWQNAFVITSGALRGDRDRLGNRVGADEFIFIDTKKEICMERGKDKEGSKYLEIINNWFDHYQE